MAIAVIAHHESQSTSQCAWYFVAYTFDTTIGVLLTILLHKATLRMVAAYQQCSGRGGDKGSGTGADCDVAAAEAGPVPRAETWYDTLLECGNYGNPPSLRRWAVQMAEWVVCVVLARAMCGTLVLLLGGVLVWVAGGLDAAFAGPLIAADRICLCGGLCRSGHSC